jgi:hypothetical protein
MMPIIEKMLYSQTQDIRDKAISIIADLRTVVHENEKEMIMAVTLRMAQDENEYNREAAVKLLNEIAPDMGQEICEYFIVPTFKSLGLDTHTFVRITVVKNLLNISNNVSLEYFSQKIFPLYLELSQDREEKVRKSCADVVADIAKVSPLE